MGKKIFIALIVILLVGCNSNGEIKNNSSTELVIPEEMEVASNEQGSTENESEEIVLEKEKKYPLKPVSDVKNVLSFIPEDYYYNDAGELVVKGYVQNDIEYTTTGVRVRRLEIYNENEEMLASNCFGYIYDNIRFDPDESFEITYTFPAITVLIDDDDLDTIETVFKTSSAVEYYDTFIKE